MPARTIVAAAESEIPRLLLSATVLSDPGMPLRALAQAC